MQCGIEFFWYQTPTPNRTSSVGGVPHKNATERNICIIRVFTVAGSLVKYKYGRGVVVFTAIRAHISDLLMRDLMSIHATLRSVLICVR